MRVAFDDRATWVAERESVLVRATTDVHTVRCFVSREVLDDHFGGDDSNDYVAVFNAHRAEILKVARTLIAADMFSPEGDIIVGTVNF